MNERDTMLHLSELSAARALSTLIPAAPAVRCDAGLRLEHDGVWCDAGARLFGQDVWCDPGVRLELEAEELQRVDDMAALWSVSEERYPIFELPAFELPRFGAPAARIERPAIPQRLSRAERLRQRCDKLVRQFGWDSDDARELLEEVLADGASEGYVVRLVEEADGMDAALLHTVWQVRSDWYHDGPHNTRFDGKLSWDQAATLVMCAEASDAEQVLVLLDDAYRQWTMGGGWWELGGFYDALMSWVIEADSADIARHAFPW